MGTGGVSVIPSGISWGFSAGDVWTNSMAVVSSLAGFILLALAIAFAPRIIAVLKGLFRSRRA